jgi:Family of unknown function (DUF6687)
MERQISRRFVPYEELGSTPNIVVDGSGNAQTSITLSHWPKSGTPRALKADTSAEIVFNYLDAPAFHVAAEAVSNNHFDEDGLIGVFALLQPDDAMEMRDLLVDAARAGDFATYRHRRAACIAFTVSAFADAATSSLDPAIFARPYAEQCAALYREMLPRLSEIATDTERFRRYWEEEERVLEESERAIRDGRVRIEELPEIDLAVVTLPDGWSPHAVHRFTHSREESCHPMAVHNATRRNCILTLQGRRYGAAYRYESWVQYMTAAPRPRADLTPLAEVLSAEEPGETVWSFDGVAALTPRLALPEDRESAIPPEAFTARFIEFLAAAKPAWDPYDLQ